MRLKDCYIAWSGDEGSLIVAPLTDRKRCRGLDFFVEFKQRLSRHEAMLMVVTYFMELLFLYNFPKEVIHQEFCKIREYRDLFPDDLMSAWRIGDNDEVWWLRNPALMPILTNPNDKENNHG